MRRTVDEYHEEEGKSTEGVQRSQTRLRLVLGGGKDRNFVGDCCGATTLHEQEDELNKDSQS